MFVGFVFVVWSWKQLQQKLFPTLDIFPDAPACLSYQTFFCSLAAFMLYFKPFWLTLNFLIYSAFEVLVIIAHFFWHLCCFLLIDGLADCYPLAFNEPSLFQKWCLIGCEITCNEESFPVQRFLSPWGRSVAGLCRNAVSREMVKHLGFLCSVASFCGEIMGGKYHSKGVCVKTVSKPFLFLSCM